MVFIKGSMTTNDGRFKNKMKKIINQINFPIELNVKIDMSKINIKIFEAWISKKIENILGVEDEILSNMVTNELEKEQCPDPRNLYVQLIPFLDCHVRKFMKQLWGLLINAQENGIEFSKELVKNFPNLNKKKINKSWYGKVLREQIEDNKHKLKKQKK